MVPIRYLLRHAFSLHLLCAHRHLLYRPHKSSEVRQGLLTRYCKLLSSSGKFRTKHSPCRHHRLICGNLHTLAVNGVVCCSYWRRMPGIFIRGIQFMLVISKMVSSMMRIIRSSSGVLSITARVVTMLSRAAGVMVSSFSCRILRICFVIRADVPWPVPRPVVQPSWHSLVPSVLALSTFHISTVPCLDHMLRDNHPFLSVLS